MGKTNKRTRLQRRSSTSSTSTSSSASSNSSDERYRRRKGSKYHSDKSRSYTPTPGEKSESKIKRLEFAVARLSKENDKLSRQREIKFMVKSDCIPEFSPDNRSLTASQWLDTIEQLKQVNEWSNATTIYHMQSRLSGMAKSWYHSLLSYNYTWDEWKALIRKTFPENIDYASALKKMLERQKQSTESMTTYYFEKMELLRICEITGKKSVSCIIDGITDTVVQNSARAGRYETPEALYEQYLFALEEDSTKKDEEKVSSHVSKVDLRNSIKDKQHSRHLRENNVRCFNCNEKGHTFARCTKPKKFCAKCNRVGHVESHCFAKTKRGTGKGTEVCEAQPQDLKEVRANVAENIEKQQDVQKLYYDLRHAEI